MAQSEATATPFSADHDDQLPVGVQLGWRLRALISAGRLTPGERLPSVRDLAQWADVNVNTVRSVYARLEADGLVATRQGSGSFVADGAGGSPEVERIAAEALDAAAKAGVDPRDVAIVALVSAGLPAIPDELPPAGPADDEGPGEVAAELGLDADSWLNAPEGAARRELRRQIGKLESELAAYPPDPDRWSAPARAVEPRIAGVAELAATRDALLGDLAAARNTAALRSRREGRAREVRDAIVADPAAHRWEVVSAAETGEEGCTTWQVAPRMGPLGALMSWWRIKVSGGCPLAPPLAAAS
jgi:DNA-binding transcriptional regulator YhcF (GntR family)